MCNADMFLLVLCIFIGRCGHLLFPRDVRKLQWRHCRLEINRVLMMFVCFFHHPIWADCFWPNVLRFLRKMVKKHMNFRIQMAMMAGRIPGFYPTFLFNLESKISPGCHGFHRASDRGQRCPEAGSAARCAEFAEQYAHGLQAQRRSGRSKQGWGVIL